MNTKIRSLYKYFMWAARDYPGDINIVRSKVKHSFRTTPFSQEAIDKGYYIAEELHRIGRFDRYRKMKKRYD